MAKDRVTKICSIENCSLKTQARGWCSKHYQHWHKYGYPEATRMYGPDCLVEGCDRPYEGRGYCKLHRERIKRHNTTDKPIQKQCYVVKCVRRKYQDTQYCKQHWTALTAFGDINYPFTREELFWTLVDKTSGLGRDGDCWEWTGGVARHNKPYGVFIIDKKCWRTHRLSYMWATGKIPVLDVLHSCDNPRCVNPKHLSEGTTQENTRQRVERGRTICGERHKLAYLTADIIRNIRDMATKGMTHKEIQIKYGISNSHIKRIINRESWKHIE